MRTDIKSFMEELIGTTPNNFDVNPYNSIFRAPLVGSRGVPGTGRSSTDVIQTMRRAALEFAEAYEDPDASPEKVKALSEKIEGTLMVQETLSILSHEKAESLLDQLQDLMKRA